MEIHWIAVLLTIWWFPNDTVTISNYHQQQGSDWTIDKAKLIYHFTSTEQYNPSLRQAKNIFPVQQPTANQRDDNSQNRYQHNQQFRNYNANNNNNNIQIQQAQQQPPPPAYGVPFMRQYPPVTNQFSPHWKNFSPPVPPQPPQSFPPPGNQMKITRPSLPDLLPVILQNQNNGPQNAPNYNEKQNNFQFKPSSPIAPAIDARILSRPNNIPLVVPTQSSFPENNVSEVENNPPRFSPPVPKAQSLVTYPPKPPSYEQTNTNRPSPVYSPSSTQQEQSTQSVDSQSNSNYYQHEETPINHTGEESNTNTNTYPVPNEKLDPNREIRFLIHKAGDEEIIKKAISDESRYSNEEVSFIRGPDIQLQRKQKIYLPPKKKTVVYILLKEPQIETNVEVMEQEEDPKPEVYIIYQKGQEMLTRHYSADSNTIKTVKNLILPPSANDLNKGYLAGASSIRKETVVKAPPAKSPNPATTPLCLNNKPLSTVAATTPKSSSTASSSKNPINRTVKTITKS